MTEPFIIPLWSVGGMWFDPVNPPSPPRRTHACARVPADSFYHSQYVDARVYVCMFCLFVCLFVCFCVTCESQFDPFVPDSLLLTQLQKLEAKLDAGLMRRLVTVQESVTQPPVANHILRFLSFLRLLWCRFCFGLSEKLMHPSKTCSLLSFALFFLLSRPFFFVSSSFSFSFSFSLSFCLSLSYSVSMSVTHMHTKHIKRWNQKLWNRHVGP